ncbi:UDP-N-acetylmuramate--L-alanine ligase [Calditrichota bacterium]
MIEELIHNFRKAHLVGIGGSGMSGIAEILIGEGFQVSGSDLAENDSIQRLRRLGADIHIGHRAELVENAEVVVYTSAVNASHVEIQAAMIRRIPVIRRAEMLAELMRMKAGIAISGTHGKTTVTSLVSEILIAGGLDPSTIVGGKLIKAGTGTRSGKGDFIIAEADEFDKSFLKLTPMMVVITNIDSDHIECYGNYDDLKNAFIQFANSVPFYGKAIVCMDDEPLKSIMSRVQRPVVTYGIDGDVNVKATNLRYDRGYTRFEMIAYGDVVGEVKLPIPGRHNVRNALAASAIGIELGIEFSAIQKGLEGFRGVHRRFEILGEKGDVIVADDFAHHPAEIAATLEAAKTGWDRRVVAVFQPHLYSRTKELAVEFGRSLLAADTVYVLPIFPAREEPIEGVSSGLVVEAAKAAGHRNVTMVEDRNQISSLVKNTVRSGDMVLTLGAGDVYELSTMIFEDLDGEIDD